MDKFIDPINQIDRELHCSHNQLSSKIRNHESNLDIHVTKDDKDLWNSKADKSYVDAEQSKTKSYTDEQISTVNDNIANTLQDYTTKEYSDSIYSNKDIVNSSLSDINKQISSKADKTYVDSVKQHVDQIDSNITTNHYTKQQVDSKLDDVSGKDYSITRFDLQGNKLTIDQTNGKQRQVTLPIGLDQDQIVTKDQLNSQLASYVKTKSINTLTIQQGEDQAVYNPILSDRFIQIAGGESPNNRYVPYFQNTTSNTQAPLVPDNGKFPHDCTDPVQRKWSTSSTIRQSGEYTWVTYVYINSLNYPQLWVTPICITGENGEDGVDTTKREFIYRTSTTAEPNFYVPDTSLNQDGYVPSGWSNSPNGVNEINQYEWMCYRDKANDVWSKWKPLGDNQKPLIWSHFGVNGIDADGIEYIYYAGKDVPSDNPNSWYTNQQSIDGNADANGIQYNSNNYIPKDSKWKQDPVDLTGQQYGQGFYQFVSIRKKTSDDNSSKKYWHQYSIPTLWSYYAMDGAQGLKGSPLRYAGEHKTNTVYYDGTVSINGIYYQDYVLYNNVYYICTSWQKGTDNNWSKTPDSAEYFKPVSMNDAQFINQLISNKAYIEELSSNEVVITDNNEIVAGMTSGKKIGGTSSLNGKVNNKGDVRIWAGGIPNGDLTEAPFTVTNTGIVTSGTKNKIILDNGIIWFVVNGKKWHLGITDGKPDWIQQSNIIRNYYCYKVTDRGSGEVEVNMQKFIFDVTDNIYYDDYASKHKANGDFYDNVYADGLSEYGFVTEGSSGHFLNDFVRGYKKVTFTDGVKSDNDFYVLIGNLYNDDGNGHITRSDKQLYYKTAYNFTPGSSSEIHDYSGQPKWADVNFQDSYVNIKEVQMANSIHSYTSSDAAASYVGLNENENAIIVRSFPNDSVQMSKKIDIF